jgi:hypothetical protein
MTLGLAILGLVACYGIIPLDLGLQGGNALLTITGIASLSASAICFPASFMIGRHWKRLVRERAFDPNADNWDDSRKEEGRRREAEALRFMEEQSVVSDLTCAEET